MDPIIVPREVLLKATNLAIEYLIKRYDELGMRASGNWAQQLEAEVRDTTAVIMGTPYTVQLVNGREPGRMPPVDAIYQWMLDKRTFTGEKSMSRAWAIAKTIQKEGTSWYKRGGSSLLEILDEPEIQNIFIEEFRIYLVTTIREIFSREIKTLKS